MVGRLKVGASAIPYYRPKDGQRVVADYSIIAATPTKQYIQPCCSLE